MSKRVEFLKFNTFEGLVGWLTTTKWGAEAIREALYSRNGERFYAEFVERELCEIELPPQPTYVLVKAFGDGWIEVYGERHVRAKVIELPARRSADADKLIEEWVGLNLKLPYQQIDYPSCKRASGYVPPLMELGEYLRAIRLREFELELVNSLTRAGKILRGEQ